MIDKNSRKKSLKIFVAFGTFPEMPRSRAKFRLLYILISELAMRKQGVSSVHKCRRLTV